jgi:hypothetical protein
VSVRTRTCLGCDGQGSVITERPALEKIQQLGGLQRGYSLFQVGALPRLPRLRNRHRALGLHRTRDLLSRRDLRRDGARQHEPGGARRTRVVEHWRRAGRKPRLVGSLPAVQRSRARRRTGARGGHSGLPRGPRPEGRVVSRFGRGVRCDTCGRISRNKGGRLRACRRVGRLHHRPGPRQERDAGHLHGLRSQDHPDESGDRGRPPRRRRGLRPVVVLRLRGLSPGAPCVISRAGGPAL